MRSGVKILEVQNSELGYWFNITVDGGYILAGYTDSYGNGDKDILPYIKWSVQGPLIYESNFGGRGGDYEGHVEQTSDIGYIITLNHTILKMEPMTFGL